ncbi:hypothetical protein SAMN05216249_10855 [Acetitomaculum ruminis DSM 5522]|uniref:Uncharacterized protein n=1 Tax=Acetitomaculum ruminis DSM 5522 TaxID=1120918 RepID=A0A1I0Y1A7_9FIRM|nr:hypothetical protein [Acetitomaculum ruminis]SFB06657.1 hypothetical protein SAMN05216249_10855 [Acetitomaculum ruminis DSM 5522]
MKDSLSTPEIHWDKYNSRRPNNTDEDKGFVADLVVSIIFYILIAAVVFCINFSDFIGIDAGLKSGLKLIAGPLSAGFLTIFLIYLMKTAKLTLVYIFEALFAGILTIASLVIEIGFYDYLPYDLTIVACTGIAVFIVSVYGLITNLMVTD